MGGKKKSILLQLDLRLLLFKIQDCTCDFLIPINCHSGGVFSFPPCEVTVMITCLETSLKYKELYWTVEVFAPDLALGDLLWLFH